MNYVGIGLAVMVLWLASASEQGVIGCWGFVLGMVVVSTWLGLQMVAKIYFDKRGK